MTASTAVENTEPSGVETADVDVVVFPMDGERGVERPFRPEQAPGSGIERHAGQVHARRLVDGVGDSLAEQPAGCLVSCGSAVAVLPSTSV